jgi:hypothetical protein
MRVLPPSSSPEIRKPVWENCEALHKDGSRWKIATQRLRNVS